MSTCVKITVCLLVCLNCCSVTGQRVGSCADIIKSDFISMETACDAIKNFTKCLMRETRTHTLPPSDESLDELKSFLQTELNKLGIKCEIDIAALAEEVCGEEAQMVEEVTTPPKGYKESTTIFECLDSLKAELSKDGDRKFECRSLHPYIKCRIRVLNITKLTSNNTDENTLMGPPLKQVLEQLGEECNIDYQVLIEEVRQEQAEENRASFVDFTFHSIVLLAPFLISFIFH